MTGKALGRLELVDFDRLAFELLVVLEEAAEHHQPVRRQLAGLAEAVELGVVDGHGEDLVVALAAVDHRHQADRPRRDQRQRRDGSWQSTSTSSGSSSSA